MAQTETPVETLELIAERIAKKFFEPRLEARQYRGLRDALEAALKGRDERAAKICETGAMLASPIGVIPAGDPEHERLKRLSDVLNSAARAIREGR